MASSLTLAAPTRPHLPVYADSVVDYFVVGHVRIVTMCVCVSVCVCVYDVVFVVFGHLTTTIRVSCVGACVCHLKCLVYSLTPRNECDSDQIKHSYAQNRIEMEKKTNRQQTGESSLSLVLSHNFFFAGHPSGPVRVFFIFFFRTEFAWFSTFALNRNVRLRHVWIRQKKKEKRRRRWRQRRK